MAILPSRIPLAVALAALPACASAGESPETLPGPVTYEVRSWGRILLRWQVTPDGSGEIWRGPRELRDKYVLRKFRLRLQGNALRTFVADVEELREATRAGVECTKETFDLPYGSITWDYPRAKRTYSFDSGCRSEKGDAVLDMLTATDTVVETMARIDAHPYIVEPER